MSLSLDYTPTPFDDTYILYNKDDLLSLAAVFFTLLPFGVLVFYLSWFIVSREIEPVYMAIGQVANDIVNNIVKNYIKQDRPMKIEGFQENGLRSGYGMPSAHSQFMAFFSIYLILRIWFKWEGLSNLRKVLSTIGLFLLSFCVVYSRVYLHYHNWQQVLVGLLIGFITGSLHYLFISFIRSSGINDFLLNWKLLKLFWIKDSVYYEPNSLRQEYENWLDRKSKKTK